MEHTTKVFLGALSYGNPWANQRSGNIGDYVQTLAALNVYRHFVNARHNTETDMDTFLSQALSNSVPGVRFIFLDRDNMSSEASKHKDKRIFTIMNGWFQNHTSASGDFDWPPPENVVPLMVSFHAATPDILMTDAGVAYFKKHQPIGCRDKFTQTLMEKHGVQAYFSGCLTTTIDFYHHHQENDTTFLVDVNHQPLDGQVTHVTHWDPKTQKKTTAENLVSALHLLHQYSVAKQVITSRLHCFLPCRAMGVPIQMLHPDGKDATTWSCPNRFEGLVFNVEQLNVSVQSLVKRLNGLLK